MPTGGKAHAVANEAERIAVGTAWAWDRRLEGHSVRAIAGMSEAALGYPVSKSTIMNWVDAHATEMNEESAGKRELFRRMELEKLDVLEARAQAVMDATHYVMNAGKLVEGPDGTWLVDDAPVLAASAMKLRVQERRAKLEGWDDSQPIVVDGVMRYVIEGADISKVLGVNIDHSTD